MKLSITKSQYDELVANGEGEACEAAYTLDTMVQAKVQRKRKNHRHGELLSVGRIKLACNGAKTLDVFNSIRKVLKIAGEPADRITVTQMVCDDLELGKGTVSSTISKLIASGNLKSRKPKGQ